MSLRFRLSLLLLVSVGCVLLLLVRSVLYDVRPQYLASMEDVLVDVAHILAESVQVKDGSIDVRQFEQTFEHKDSVNIHAQIYDKLKQKIEINCYICDAQGILLFSSNDEDLIGSYYGDWNDVYLCLRGSYGARTSLVDPERPETAILYVAAPITQEGQIVGSLTVSKPSDGVTAFVESGHKHIIIVGVLSLAVLALTITVVTLWVTRPVHRLRKFVQDIQEQEQALTPHFTVPELREVAHAISDLRVALDGKEYIETYVQQLTHELKSPLSVIAGASELLHEDMQDEQRQKFLSNIDREARRMQLIVDRILFLAGVENRRGVSAFRSINITDMVIAVIDSLTPLTEERSQDLNFPNVTEEVIHYVGDADLIEMAIRNVVFNAVLYSGVEATIEVQLKKENNCVRFICEDNGPGVPEFALARLGERFYSIQQTTTKHKGTGLGISLVKAVMELHGGGMEISNLDPHGLRVCLDLPIDSTKTS